MLACVPSHPCTRPDGLPASTGKDTHTDWTDSITLMTVIGTPICNRKPLVESSAALQSRNSPNFHAHELPMAQIRLIFMSWNVLVVLLIVSLYFVGAVPIPFNDCSIRPDFKSPYIYPHIEKTASSTGCASTERTSSGQEVHVINLKSGATGEEKQNRVTLNIRPFNDAGKWGK